MTVTTNTGLILKTNWAWSMNIMGVNTLMINFQNDRSILDIASDLQGSNTFYRESEEEGNMTFEGFNDLVMINHPDVLNNPSQVEIRFIKREGV